MDALDTAEHRLITVFAPAIAAWWGELRAAAGDDPDAVRAAAALRDGLIGALVEVAVPVAVAVDGFTATFDAVVLDEHGRPDHDGDLLRWWVTRRLLAVGYRIGAATDHPVGDRF